MKPDHADKQKQVVDGLCQALTHKQVEPGKYGAAHFDLGMLKKILSEVVPVVLPLLPMGTSIQAAIKLILPVAENIIDLVQNTQANGEPASP